MTEKFTWFEHITTSERHAQLIWEEILEAIKKVGREDIWGTHIKCLLQIKVSA